MEASAIRFVTRKNRCVHRLRPVDVPRGIDPDDVTRPCAKDPHCPEKKNRQRRKS